MPNSVPLQPSPAEFRELAKRGNTIPIYTELIADAESPVSAFQKIDEGGYSFLFESVEKSDQAGRYSFVGAQPRLTFESRGRTIRIVEDGVAREFETARDPLHELEALMRRFTFVPSPALEDSRFAGGAVGYLGYDMVRFFEPTIAAPPPDQLGLPESFFFLAETVDALTLYRALRFVNPSPYMFCMKFAGQFALVGSSPEVHVRAINGRIDIRPIAGTRRRGANAAEDDANAAELLADPKERAEHLMLVDLARNDVGRAAEYGSVQVSDFMTVEKYSHVMHIVSNVHGTLRPDRTAYDVMRATFPAGTVSGSPKVRAMQIINQLEKSKRGVYAGAVGYFGFDGHSDSCIALRTVVLKDGKAFVQAGAGIVADSSPESEHQECVNKAMGMMAAIARAKGI